MIAKTSVFKASAKADQLLDDLSPMLALRRLDVTDPDKLEEIGLGSPSATLDIVRDGQTQSLEIGGEAYGSRHIYVRRVADGQIYLVERELLQGLKYARSRLADHGLIGMPVKTIAKARITAGGATLAAVQKNADDSKAAVWALESDEESRPEQLTTWMGQALKLKGMRYADPEDGPADLKARFSLVLTDAKGDSDTLEVLQVGEGGDWYGRSGHTRGLVKLVRSAARSLADDVESVIEAGD
jgi:hypothetical protein